MHGSLRPLGMCGGMSRHVCSHRWWRAALEVSWRRIWVNCWQHWGPATSVNSKKTHRRVSDHSLFTFCIEVYTTSSLSVSWVFFCRIFPHLLCRVDVDALVELILKQQHHGVVPGDSVDPRVLQTHVLHQTTADLHDQRDELRWTETELNHRWNIQEKLLRSGKTEDNRGQPCCLCPADNPPTSHRKLWARPSLSSSWCWFPTETSEGRSHLNTNRSKT